MLQKYEALEKEVKERLPVAEGGDLLLTTTGGSSASNSSPEATLDDPFPQLIKDEVQKLRTDGKVSSLLLTRMGHLARSANRPWTEK